MTTTHLDWAPLPVRPYVEAAIASAEADPRVVGLIVVGSGAGGGEDATRAYLAEIEARLAGDGVEQQHTN